MVNDFLILDDKIYIRESVTLNFMTSDQISDKLEHNEFIIRDTISYIKPKIPMASSVYAATQPIAPTIWLEHMQQGFTASPFLLCDEDYNLFIWFKDLLTVVKPALYNLIFLLRCLACLPEVIDLLEDFFKYFSYIFPESTDGKDTTEYFCCEAAEVAEAAKAAKVAEAPETAERPPLLQTREAVLTHTQFQPVIESNKYFFYCHTSDFYNTEGVVAKAKATVDDHNKKIVVMDKNQNSESWNYFKSYFYRYKIEKVPHSFFNGFAPFWKLPLNEITIEKLLAVMFIQAFEYWEEYIFLIKVKLGMEILMCKSNLSKFILYTKYTVEEINEAKVCLLKY
jgi:hypothetical protein